MITVKCLSSISIFDIFLTSIQKVTNLLFADRDDREIGIINIKSSYI